VGSGVVLMKDASNDRERNSKEEEQTECLQAPAIRFMGPETLRWEPWQNFNPKGVQHAEDIEYLYLCNKVESIALDTHISYVHACTHAHMQHTQDTYTHTSTHTHHTHTHTHTCTHTNEHT